MSADDKSPQGNGAAQIERKAARKIKARREGRHSIWFGFGMFGLIGWAVAVPTLIGVALGLWLDRVAPTSFSWTLALIVAGVCLGCWNAWRWVSQERSDD
ncbi:AtpZ/AtpI family protein [Hyphococcus luteus]|uniref:ATPase F0F1 n=1 Tax=Hyphococcus luteus TaxID=2058213 RepID=A0A2S7KAP9_9PROT|nr:AtpZ/AtpI family protein [Marinicaulis flavus]PQA89575.1 ATPase F0F1 [Marinicaulis flavus]